MSLLLPEQPESHGHADSYSVGRGKKWLQRSAITASALVAVLVAGAAIYLTSMNDNIKRADLMTETAAAAPASAKDALNIAIFGSAYADNGFSAKANKGSVVMVLHISADRKAATLLSFPNATYLPVPGHGMAPLAAAYGMGGSKLTVTTVEKTLNTRIDHVMVPSFNGFAELMKQVGSVTIDNPEAFSAGGFSFDQGKISLSNDEAFAFIKARKHESADEEASKEARQRLVLEAGLQKALTRETLSNPGKLNNFVRTVTSNTTVDKGFTATAIAKIATSLRLTSKSIDLVRAPLSYEVTTEEFQVDGGEKSERNLQELDPVKFKELATAVSQDKLPAYIAKYPGKD